MDLKFFYTKQFYLLKQKVDALNERDRILLLFIIAVVLFFLWLFALAKPINNSRNETYQQIQKVRNQITALTQKQKIIKILVSNPDTAQTIAHFKELTAKVAELDKALTHYNEHYISERELAKLLHDMLKQTMDVTIENFGTLTIPVAPVNPSINTVTPSISSVPTAASLRTLQTTHYRLVMHGTYFPVMRYLQRLEQLSWQLYWDKFDYTVAKYPEGVATVDFYTLKPQAAQRLRKQRSSQQ